MSVGFNIRLLNLFICKFSLNFSGFGLRFCNYKFRKMRVSNYRRAHKVYILLNISGKCGFQNAAGPINYDYVHLPLVYGLCRTKMFAVSLLLEAIFVLCIRRRYSRVRFVLVCTRGFG